MHIVPSGQASELVDLNNFTRRRERSQRKDGALMFPGPRRSFRE